MRVKYTAKQISDITGLDIPNGISPDTVFEKVNFDKEHITQGSLFLSYYQNDCSNVLKAGASAVLCPGQEPMDKCFVTPDFQKTLFDWAQKISGSMSIPPTLLIAGSEGKTTTKRFINRILQKKYEVFCSEENANSMSSLISFLPRLSPSNNYFIWECDEKRCNNTKYISEILKPEIVCITNMLDAHIEFLGSQENIDKSIAETAAFLKEGGCVVINSDDPESKKYPFNCNVISVAINDKSADCIATNIDSTIKGTSFDIDYQGEKTRVHLTIPGEHNIYNAMMAFVVGKMKGVKEKDIVKALAEDVSDSIRQNICKYKGKTIVIDCFNASDKSIEFALKLFSKIKSNGKKVAVFGDIGGIKGSEEMMYSNIAKNADLYNIDVLVTCGEKSCMIADYIKGSIECYHANTIAEAISILQKIEGAKCFLFKASNFMHLENAAYGAFPGLKEKLKRKNKINRIKKRLKRVLLRGE